MLEIDMNRETHGYLGLCYQACHMTVVLGNGLMDTSNPQLTVTLLETKRT